MSRNFWGFGAALGATSVWAGNFVAARALAEQIPPMQFNFWRWVIAFLVMLPFAFHHLKSDLRTTQGHWIYLTLMAIVGITLMNTLIYKAGQSTESLNMALIMPATPIVIMVLARLLYGETITRRRLMGMLCASAGILILISRGSLANFASLEIQAGDIWTLGGMLCFALYSLFMRLRPQGISPVGFNVIVFGLGLVCCLPVLAWEMFSLPLPTLNWAVASGIAYSGIGCSAIAFWLWTVAIDSIGPVRSGIVYYSLPFFAAIMAKALLDENVSAPQICGGMLIIGGILLATMTVNLRHETRHLRRTKKNSATI